MGANIGDFAIDTEDTGDVLGYDVEWPQLKALKYTVQGSSEAGPRDPALAQLPVTPGDFVRDLGRLVLRWFGWFPIRRRSDSIWHRIL